MLPDSYFDRIRGEVNSRVTIYFLSQGNSSIYVYFKQAKLSEMTTFSQNFSILLKKIGINQAEIAARTGIHKQSIHRYVTGKSIPAWNELLKLAEALDCSLDSFVTGIYEKKKSPESLNLLSNLLSKVNEEADQLAEIVQRLKNLTDN